MDFVKDWFLDHAKQAFFDWVNSIGVPTLAFYSLIVLAGLWLVNRALDRFSKVAPLVLGIALIAAAVAFYNQPPPPPPPPVVETTLIDAEAIGKIGNGIKDAADAAGELAKKAMEEAEAMTKAAAKALADAMPKPPTPEELAERERLAAEQKAKDEAAAAEAARLAKIEAEKKRQAQIKAARAHRKQREFAMEMEYNAWLGQMTQQQLYEAELQRQRQDAQFRGLMQPPVIIQPRPQQPAHQQPPSHRHK